ncbi:hypothetical protein Pmani_016922 [Petrolisthes manimaculis]|uniref:Uncharacterized protein n=1 Tax=Petrolisthes manimaculis TaxID=1843537 RepID=A0AAE1U893_9EUCA|nr:hypothetical protein Pmani_016922 [Petrolisthes manimaculis]
MGGVGAAAAVRPSPARWCGRILEPPPSCRLPPPRERPGARQVDTGANLYNADPKGKVITLQARDSNTVVVFAFTQSRLH